MPMAISATSAVAKAGAQASSPEMRSDSCGQSDIGPAPVTERLDPLSRRLFCKTAISARQQEDMCLLRRPAAQQRPSPLPLWTPPVPLETPIYVCKTRKMLLTPEHIH